MVNFSVAILEGHPGGPYLVNQSLDPTGNKTVSTEQLQWNETGVFIQYTCFLFELGGIAIFPWIIKGISCIFIFFGAHLFFYYLWLYAIFNLYVDFYRFIVHRGFSVLGLVFIEVHSMEIRVWTCHKDNIVIGTGTCLGTAVVWAIVLVVYSYMTVLQIWLRHTQKQHSLLTWSLSSYHHIDRFQMC